MAKKFVSIHARCLATTKHEGWTAVCDRSKGHKDDKGHHDVDLELWWKDGEGSE